MDEQRDFTIDPINYVGLEDYVDDLHADGKHYVIILVTVFVPLAHWTYVTVCNYLCRIHV